MKKLIALTLALIALCGVASADLYPMTARVFKIDYTEDVVIVETYDGFLFAFEGTDGYAEGESVALIMEDNGTEKIFDDEIIMAQCGGWELMGE